MSDKQRELLAVRTIRVSTRAALRAASSDEEVERVKTMSAELLARLESDVIRDGADPAIMAAVEDARRELQD